MFDSHYYHYAASSYRSSYCELSHIYGAGKVCADLPFVRPSMLWRKKAFSVSSSRLASCLTTYIESYLAALYSVYIQRERGNISGRKCILPWLVGIWEKNIGDQRGLQKQAVDHALGPDIRVGSSVRGSKTPL